MHVTFESLMAHLKEIGSPMYQFYNVERKAFVIPDFFHIDNIAINTASIIFLGDIERGNMSQFHPRQLLQSIHSLHSVSKVLSQNAINKILADLPSDVLLAYILLTCRERPQRWRVNGHFARRILEAFKIVNESGENLITLWAREMYTIGGNLGGTVTQSG